MEYFVFLKNYESLYVIKTNTYNKEVIECLKWFYGYNYDVVIVLENPKVTFSTSYIIESKDEILEELEWKRHSYWFDEEGEELDSKIKFLTSILI